MARRRQSFDAALGMTPKGEKVAQALTLCVRREFQSVVLPNVHKRGWHFACCRRTDSRRGGLVRCEELLRRPYCEAFRSREILAFRNDHYQEGLSPGSYDDVRRKDLVLLVGAGLASPSAKDAAADINDGTRGYALTLRRFGPVRSFRTDRWDDVLKSFRASQPQIKDRLAKARQFSMVPVTLPDGSQLELSPGPPTIRFRNMWWSSSYNASHMER